MNAESSPNLPFVLFQVKAGLYAVSSKNVREIVMLLKAVERIPEENIEPMPASMAEQNTRSQWRVGRRIKTNQTILLLDEDSLVGTKAPL